MTRDFLLHFSVAVNGSIEKFRKQDKLQKDACRGLSSFSVTGMSQCCLRWLITEILPDPFLNCSFLYPATSLSLWLSPCIASLSEGFLLEPHFTLLHFAMPSQSSSGKEGDVCMLGAFLTTPNMTNTSPHTKSLWELYSDSGLSGKTGSSTTNAFSRHLIAKKHHTLT